MKKHFFNALAGFALIFALCLGFTSDIEKSEAQAEGYEWAKGHWVTLEGGTVAMKCDNTGPETCQRKKKKAELTSI